MSSLHPDRLPAEGPAPASGTRSTLAAAPGTTSRGATGRTKGTAEVSAKATASHTSRTAAQRTGKLPAGSTPTPQGSSAARARTVRTAAATATATARAARTVTAKAARSATATAKAASAKAAGAKTASAAKRAAAQPAAAAKPAAASKATPAKATPAKAAPAKAAPAKATPAKATPAKATPAKVAPAKAADAERTPTEATTPRPAHRPTPYKRTVVTHDRPAETTPEDAAIAAAAEIVETGRALPVDVTVVDAPIAGVLDIDEAAADAPEERATAATAPRRVRIRHRRPPASSRRPALYLAAALVGALGIGGVSAGGPAALAETTEVSSSVSVAETLGIASDSAEVVEAQAPDRLGELVASRAERDAEQADAAAEQKAADEKALEKKRAAAEAAAEAARPKAVAPVKGARLTSGYGARWGTLHAGIDLAAPMHTPEYAVMDGVVLEAGPASGFGLAVYIQHENGDVTVYGHMDSILVQAGQVVKAGDTIALLGNRGQSTGPHLHFEVHQGGLDGAKVDPIPWLRDRGVEL